MAFSAKKKKVVKVAKIFISVSLLYYLFSQVDLQSLWKQIKELNLYVVLVAFFILTVQGLLSSLKWKIIITADKAKIPFWFLVKSYLIGNFISLFLPTSFGGDIYRVYALKGYNRDYIQNTSSVLLDRLSGLFALVSIAVVSTALYSRSFNHYPLLVFYFLGILLFWLVTSNLMIGRLEKFDNKYLNPAKRMIASFYKFRINKKILFSSLLISFFYQFNIIVINKLYSHALGFYLPFSFLLMVIPLIYLTEALPIAINGLGVREGAFVFFYTQKGISAEEALAAALIVIAVRYTYTMVVGGTLFLREMLRPKQNNNHHYKAGKLPLTTE
jgi:uncharacterized protein (TIRG00374 family)